MQDILDILELKIVVSERFTDMWTCADRDQFDDAVYNQLFYLFYNDLLESKLNELSEEDKEYMDYLSILAVKGK